MSFDFEAELIALKEEKSKLEAHLGSTTDMQLLFVINQRLLANQQAQTECMKHITSLACSRNSASGTLHMSRGDCSKEIQNGLVVSAPSHTGCVHVPVMDSAKTEDQLQKLYDTLATPENGETTLQATSEKVVMRWANEDYKPDITIYNKRLENKHAGIAAVIELKRPNDGEKEITSPPQEGAAEIRQLIGYLHAMMMLQKNRAFAFGILTNGRYMEVYEAQRKPPTSGGRISTELEYFLRYTGSFKEEWIQFICSATLVQLGCNPPTITLGDASLVLNNYLGSGQYSHGYEVHHGGATFVVKQYTDEGIAKRERDTCVALARVSGAAHLHTMQPKESLFVAITPKGLPFNNSDRKIAKQHVLHLRHTLQQMHEAGYVHNDIVSSNIYFIDDKMTLLNDWSHSEESTDEAKRQNDFLSLAAAVTDCDTSGEGLRRFAIPGFTDEELERKRTRKS